MTTLYQAIAKHWPGCLFFPLRPQISAAQLYLRRVRLQGYQGPISRNTVMFGPAHVGLRVHGPSTVVISDVWVAPEARGMGLGSLLLQTLTRIADEEGVTLVLRPQPFDRGAGSSWMRTDDLVIWYGRYGFHTARTWATRKPVSPSARKAAA